MRSELGRSARLALPLVGGHLASGLIGTVDALIAGRHGTATLAAVSVGTALYFMPMMVALGTMMALPPSVSQLDAAGRRGEIGPLFRQGLWLAVGLGLLMWLLLTAVPLLLPYIGVAPELRAGAAAFVHGIRWGAPAFTAYLAMRYLCDGMHWSTPSMGFGFAGLVVLIPAGWALTFGRLGLPELGAAGLGYATSVMLWAQALGMALFLSRSRRLAPLQLFAHLEAPRRAALRGLLATGLPIGVMVLMEGGLFIATALLISRLGEVPAAAHQIAINVASLCFMIPFGIAEATTVRVGYAVGAADGAGVRRAARAGLMLALGAQAITGIVLLLGHGAIASLYTADVAVAALAGTLLLMAAAFQFSDGIQVLYAGALRGLKDTRVPMLLAAFAYWGVGMPVGAALGLSMGFGPAGMWAGLIAGLTCAAALLAWRFTRSAQRVGA